MQFSVKGKIKRIVCAEQRHRRAIKRKAKEHFFPSMLVKRYTTNHMKQIE